MAVQKKTVTKKKTTVKKTKVVKKDQKTIVVSGRLRSAKEKVFGQAKSYLARRPHRSFRMTKRRDYKRSLKISGYWSFTNFVWQTLWKNWRLFGGLALVYIVVTIIVSGIGQQESYGNLVSALKTSSGDLFKGDFGPLAQAGLLLAASVSNGLTPDVTQAQSVIGALAVLFGWLATIWALRNTLAGHKPRIRDSLYNSGSPVLSTILVSFVAIVQLLPAALGLIVYAAAQTSGMLDGGVSAMLVWVSIALMGILSLYWVSSTFIALVIVTLPGMYPMRAVKAAGDLVVGRRLRVLYRIVWLAIIVLAVWLITMIPIILFDDWIKKLVPAINWLPMVPISIITLSSATLIFTSSYIYLLYRRIVDDDAAPA